MEIIGLLYIVTCILSILSLTLLNYLIEIHKLNKQKSDAGEVWAISLIPLLNVFVLIITSIIIIHTITKNFIEQNKTKCDLYIHYKNNKLYKIVGLCKIQENNIWVDAIKYSLLNSKDIYVRSKSEFFEKFKLKENL